MRDTVGEEGLQWEREGYKFSFLSYSYFFILSSSTVHYYFHSFLSVHMAETLTSHVSLK